MADYRATIPGWLDALTHEAEAHDAAFANPQDDICGVPVRHLSLLDANRLQVIGNRFATGRFPSLVEFLAIPAARKHAYDLLAYLHVNQSTSRVVNVYRQIKYSRIPRKALYCEIRRYLDETYLDALGAQEEAGGKLSINFWANSVEYIDILASEYGWTDEYILNMPYRRLIQYVRKIIKRKNPKTPISSCSDRVTARHLEQINATARRGAN